jgi:hypothetical protein
MHVRNLLLTICGTIVVAHAQLTHDLPPLEAGVELDADSAQIYELLDLAKGLNETDCLESPTWLLNKRQHANPARSIVIFWRGLECGGGGQSYAIGEYETLNGDLCEGVGAYTSIPFRSVQQVAFCTPNRSTNTAFGFWYRAKQRGFGLDSTQACAGGNVWMPKTGCRNIDSSVYKATNMLNAIANC